MDAFRSELPLSPGSWTNYNASSGSNTHGMKININEKEIALFCYRNNFYAVDEKCPHLGNPKNNFSAIIDCQSTHHLWGWSLCQNQPFSPFTSVMYLIAPTDHINSSSCYDSYCSFNTLNHTNSSSCYDSYCSFNSLNHK